MERWHFRSMDWGLRFGLVKNNWEKAEKLSRPHLGMQKDRLPNDGQELDDQSKDKSSFFAWILSQVWQHRIKRAIRKVLHRKATPPDLPRFELGSEKRDVYGPPSYLKIHRSIEIRAIRSSWNSWANRRRGRWSCSRGHHSIPKACRLDILWWVQWLVIG